MNKLRPGVVRAFARNGRMLCPARVGSKRPAGVRPTGLTEHLWRGALTQGEHEADHHRSRVDRSGQAGRRYGPGPGHGLRAEGRQRPSGHGHEPGAGGVPALPEADAARPVRPGLDRPRPFRALPRPHLADALHPALPVRLRARTRRPQVVPHLGLAHPRPPRARPHRGRGDHHRPAGPGHRATRWAWRWPPATSAACSTRTPPRASRRSTTPSGPSSPTATWRRASPPRRPRSPATRSSATWSPCTTTTTSPSRATPRPPSARTSPPATRRTAGTYSASSRPPTATSTCTRCTRRWRRPGRRPGARRSSRPAPSSPGPPRTRRTPARRTAPRSARTRSPPPSRSWASTRSSTSRSPTRCWRTPARSPTAAVRRTPPGPSGSTRGAPPTPSAPRSSTGSVPASCRTAGRRCCRSSRPARQVATRKASGEVLAALGPVVPELWGGSADLAGSNNTTFDKNSSFLPEGNPLPGANPYGRTVHFGIREHAMGSTMNGIALHGNTRVYGGTFLVFSDYMRPAVRLAALMKLPVTYVWTHDSIGLGEDGPTHQPVEHLAALRAIPGLNMVRPADANETAVAWHEILRRAHRQAGPARPGPDPAERADLPRANRGRGQGRLRAARVRGRAAQGDPDRHRLRGAARGRRPRDAGGRGHPHPRGLDAVRRVVRRAGPGVPRPASCRPTSRPGSPSRPASA